MPKPYSLGVRVLSMFLGLVGGSLPIVLLLLDDMPYDLDTFAMFALMFSLPGFVVPFALTRAIARVIENFK